MTRAQHLPEMTAPLIWINRFASERAYPFAPREGQCRIQRIFLRHFPYRGRSFRIDTGAPQRRRDPLFTITTPHQCGPARLGKAGIVDIAKLGAAPDDRVQRSLFLALPAPFHHLARKIGSQFVPCRRIFTKISQREAVKGRKVQWFWNPALALEIAA